MPRSDTPDPPKELARLAASPARRVIGVGMLAVLGAIVLWTAIAHPPTVLGWHAFLLAVGGVSLYAAKAMWNATAQEVVLTEAGIYETSGREIASLDNIASVDRGIFAFKPSNGFLLRLKQPAPRVWALGLWWRMGRRVGVGGVTPGGEGRAMADILSALLLERETR
ncbi:MAG: hypothetical protein AAGG09_03955 [Pseudomonadota bacterium]